MQSAQNIKDERGGSSNEEVRSQQNDDYDDDYMGKNSWKPIRWLSFHYFKVLGSYKSHYKNKKFVNYRPEYNKMVRNMYMWEKFRNLGADFNLYKEVFLAQKMPFITVIILSLIIGVLALFGAYYQRFLFSQLLDHDFETSGWVFFAIIGGTAILRFFIFNYVQNLANHISANIRCYLDNALCKLVLHLPDDTSDGLLINNFFVSVVIVENAIKFMPYFIMSFVIVFGIVGFIIGIVGHIGWVVLGLTLLFLLIEFFILRRMLHLHEQYVYISDKRTSLLLLGTEMLLKLTYNGLSSLYLSLIKKYRKQQTQIDRKYNLSDGIIQIMTESISFISIFIFFIVAQTNLREHGEQDPAYKQIFQVVVLFSVFKTPIKMVGYGLSIGLEGFAGLHRLSHLFQIAQYVAPCKEDQHFPRLYPNSTCFQKTLVVKGCVQSPVQIQINSSNVVHEHQGQLIMIAGKIDANPNCDEFIDNIEKNLKDVGYSIIGYAPLIQDRSIRDNILFGMAYDQQKYERVLKIVNLREKINKFPQGDETKMDQNYFKTIYVGLAFKIEVARAIYSDIPVIIINRMIFKEYEEILIRLRDYRKSLNQTTIVVNLSGSHYNIADWIIVLGRNSREEGKYEDLKNTSTILQEFETEYLEHINLVTEDHAPTTQLSSLQEEKVDKLKVSLQDYFRFYNLSHKGAGIILLIFLLLPPLLDLYMEVIIAESVHTQQPVHSALSSVSTQVGAQTATQEHLSFDHIITLRYGIAALVFIIMNWMKIMFFTIYLKISGYKIVKRVIESFLSSKIQNTLSASNRKSALNLERNIQGIDTRITADLDVGITIIFEQLTALIFGAVSSLLFLSIGLPFFVVTLLIIMTMIFYNRTILYIRRQTRSRFNSFIKKLIIHRKAYKAYHRENYILSEYIQYNKQDIKADLNEEWLMQSLGILLQIVFICLLIATMAVSLTRFEEIHQNNEAFLELAISFLIGLTNGARINLKIFQSMDLQMIGITSIFQIISLHQKNRSEEIRTFPDHRIFTLEYRNFSVRFKDDVIHNLNLTIKAGDRIVITGSRSGGKRVAFYALMGIFEPEHILGDIYINRQPIYQEKITRSSLSELVYILENQNLTFSGDTVFEAIKVRAPKRDKVQVKYALEEIWRVLGCHALFDVDTHIKTLSHPSLDLFSFVRAIMVRPQILVIQGGLSHLDTLSRKKLTKWLIQNNEISILVDLTNRIEVIDLYPRLLQFQEGELVKNQKRKIQLNESI